jgi:hypothetical protein
MTNRLDDENQRSPAGPPDVDDASVRETKLAWAVRRGMVLGAVVTVALIGYGVCRFPSVVGATSDAPLGVCAGIGIATVYGLIGWFGPRIPGMRDPQVLRQGVRLGLGAGALFAVSMLGEYLVPHDEHQNVILAMTTFGLFFLLLSAAGFCATLATRRIGAGPLAAAWAALVASQIWFILLLTIYYACIGTPQEDRFLEVDQVLADFRRSGTRDLRAFIFEDYMGGGFFHSLLGPLLALFLGGLGGLVAKGLLLAGRASPK